MLQLVGSSSFAEARLQIIDSQPKFSPEDGVSVLIQYSTMNLVYEWIGLGLTESVRVSLIRSAFYILTMYLPIALVSFLLHALFWE